MSKAPDGGTEFCKEVIKDINQPVKILECLFALEPESWEKALEKDKQMFLKALPNTAIQFEIAEKNNFVSQIHNADVIYFRGGNAQQLVEELREITDWQEALHEKIVIGTSAGAYVLSEFYIHAAELPELRRGFGLVPTKTVAHYMSNYLHKNDLAKSRGFWKKIDNLLDSSESHLGSTKLAEGEYKIFRKSS